MTLRRYERSGGMPRCAPHGSTPLSRQGIAQPPLSLGLPAYDNLICSALWSVGSCESNTQADKERSCCAVKNVRERGASAKPVAEQRREPSKTEIPDRAGNDEAETQRNERRELGSAVCRNELRHKSEKEQRHLRVKDVRQQTLLIYRPETRR